ncbi:chemotaxis protein methyltransferase [Paenibacillus baekrokdamisoli]|uniref:protein-glutamate O-methyltransferase n=1 Tax=Paenibacillus baekrokdamisoli TaxID=1712516 RepID=A0A3G9IQ48_9BACL|nr:protein-glutamate O-methyltransferase CheR [Paenibacillus baekrokdamisoli]MBB3069656.1 chemotaxis protein methyltransferase CheR [Paenibacillus baekrokdamisoli]BBH20990.1 chemotaxis protein methyltransferase [Paenibacillus baekrokdamisoli]
MEDMDFELFVKRMKAKTDIDLSQYKEAQMKRRLTTLRQKNGFNNFAAYFDAIERDNRLLNEFLDRMTINVSEFWRNPSRWEAMEKKFIPEMLKGGGRVRIWSAACSTGEEPYTLAMIASELGALDRTSILATDLDAIVLQKAALGNYHERSIRDVPQSYLNKYFSKEDKENYTIVNHLKKSITYKQQNLLHDTFDSGFDIIVCRNVMIYFTEEAKHLLYQKFSGALRPGGILFVGSTEQIFTPAQYDFESVETFFYRKRT